MPNQMHSNQLTLFTFWGIFFSFAVNRIWQRHHQAFSVKILAALNWEIKAKVIKSFFFKSVSEQESCTINRVD